MSYIDTMERELSLRALRQNPTEAINALEAGDRIVITRRNRPVADLVPHVSTRGVTPAELVTMLARTPIDTEWSQELAEQRSVVSRDVWKDEP
ncbi:prevent-host-death family protein [Ruaniaceae bacterium KH17]|nr:prevent-host-death family protein [Ruaniaceae bacterium KH17]